MSGNKHSIMLLLSVLLQYFVVARSTNSTRNTRNEIQTTLIPLKSATMETTFPDLTANLSMDGNDVTCASSAWAPNSSMDFQLEEPAGIHRISILMHKYVDVNLGVYVGDNSNNDALCNTIQLNTGEAREVTVDCKEEIYGESISLKDQRNANEFFVLCEVKAYGTKSSEETSGYDQLALYIGIGCGAALLVIVVVLVIVFLRRRKSDPRRPSQAHSLNTLSMMTKQQVGGNAMQQRRLPIPSPRPNVVSRSIPNPYDRPMSVKDSAVIYETIPGEEPPYLTIIGEKDIYDDASSSKR